jgi:hypothetical protein
MGLGSLFKRFALGIRAFIKAFKEPEKTRKFLEGESLSKEPETTDFSQLRLLQYLQQGGRLIDFLKEDISAFNDAQVGAAVRKIHQDCARVIEELVTIRPLKDEQEGSTFQVPKGYHPAEIKVVGQVKGEPPFTGILIHRGWKAQKRSLPKRIGEQTPEIICPAEVEVKS